MLSSKDAKKANEALSAISYDSLYSLNKIMATVNWESPNAVKAAQNMIRGLVIKYGGMASKIAAEEYAAGQAIDAVFKPTTWDGLSEDDILKLNSMVENACKHVVSDSSFAGQEKTQKALRSILDESIRNIMISSTLENGLKEQAVVQSYNKFDKYREDLYKKKLRNRYARRAASGFNGVYYTIVIQSPIPCDWCIKQASRGVVFLSDETAKSVLHRAHKSCSCRVYSGTELPEGYESKLRQYKKWYYEGVPEEMDKKRKAHWEETRKARRAEESAAKKAAKEAAKQSD